jgi:hypothetical protein
VAYIDATIWCRIACVFQSFLFLINVFHLCWLIRFNYKLLYWIVTAYGQGYQSLGSKVEYKIVSSKSNASPTNFAGTNPIHVQLESDVNVNQRFVQILLSKQVIVSALSIETVENMALQSFSFAYADRGVQYPSSMITLQRLLNDKQVMYILKFISLTNICF